MLEILEFSPKWRALHIWGRNKSRLVFARPNKEFKWALEFPAFPLNSMDSWLINDFPGQRRSDALRAVDVMGVLQEKLAILSGGRDKRGGAIVTFPATPRRERAKPEDYKLLLQYLIGVPRWESVKIFPSKTWCMHINSFQFRFVSALSDQNASGWLKPHDYHWRAWTGFKNLKTNFRSWFLEDS